MALGFDFPKLLATLIFYAVTVGTFIVVGSLGSGLLLADDKLGGTVPFIIGASSASVALIILRLTRRRWVPALQAATRVVRLRLGIVYAGEELEALEQRPSAGGGGAHLAKLAEALDKRFKDDPQVREAYETAIVALAAEDPAHAARLFAKYFPRWQGVFDAPVQLAVLRALRASGQFDLASRAGERWGQKNPTARDLNTAEILALTASLLDRSLGLHEAAVPYYRRLAENFPGTPLAEHAARHLAPK